MNSEKARKRIQNSGDRSRTELGSRTSILGVEEKIGVEDEYRLTHVLNNGPTGYGKSQLLVHAALQDAEKGYGLCIVNPKGGLIDEFLAKLPEDRVEDLVYINPGQRPVTPINVLEPEISEGMTRAQKESQKEIIVSDLVDLFRRQSRNWGDRFGRLLETLLSASVDQNIRYGSSRSLVDVFRCVTQPEELSELIDGAEDPVVREQLVRMKEDLSTSELEPLQRRLNDFVMNSTVRRVVGAERSGVDFRSAVNGEKIILVDLQKGVLGKTVSERLGSIIITKVWAAAQSRISQSPEDRTPFFLYVDELQNFAGEGSSFTRLLSEAREYRLGCWLATQYLHQLDTDLRRAVINNCRTKIVFNLGGSEDVSRIAGMLQGVDRSDLAGLGRYRAVVQTPSEQSLQNAVFFDTYPPWETDCDEVEMRKEAGTVARKRSEPVNLNPSLGKMSNAGGEVHKQLLVRAKERLESRGFDVDLFYQDHGDEKPDGRVRLPTGETAYLEAEHSTLSKPGKVLRNLQRGLEQGCEVFFVVEEGKGSKLESILSDPVNRRGNSQEDTDGSFSYYTDDLDRVAVEGFRQADYRILEIGDEINQQGPADRRDCPELPSNDREELENFCFYREDGYCSELGTECVLLNDD